MFIQILWKLLLILSRRLKNKVTELKVIRSDGKERWIQSTMTAKKIMQRNCYIIIERDITDEKVQYLNCQDIICDRMTEVAENMLKENVDIPTISRSTGLDIEYIEQLYSNALKEKNI